MNDTCIGVLPRHSMGMELLSGQNSSLSSATSLISIKTSLTLCSIDVLTKKFSQGDGCQKVFHLFQNVYTYDLEEYLVHLVN